MNKKTGNHKLPKQPDQPVKQRRPRLWILWVAALGIALPLGFGRVAPELPTALPAEEPTVVPSHPRWNGYFETQPAGAWKDLPGDEDCAERVRRSDWEPRPSNRRANNTMPDPKAVSKAFAERPRGAHGSYDEKWNTWMLQRVNGQHTGTTDENIQWAACKWGLSDNLLRAIAAAESTWFHYVVDPSTGLCVETRGCGDYFTEPSAAGKVFCKEISRYGHDYTEDYPPGLCPKTFSLAGVMAWQDPAWGKMKLNQNGTFPFSRDSTAFALDYIGGFLRGCQEGWLNWLAKTGTRDYAPGDIWGCVGTWYAGSWKVPAANEYAARVRELLDKRIWLDPQWGEEYHEPYGG